MQSILFFPFKIGQWSDTNGFQSGTNPSKDPKLSGPDPNKVYIVTSILVRIKKAKEGRENHPLLSPRRNHTYN